MTSGIYKLTFNNDSVYIGKSIDMENRLKQHCDKFAKGTAAKNMQEAWNKYGLKEATGIIVAHPDHIDVLESYVINLYKKGHGDNLLNGVIPECITEAEWNVFVRNEKLLEKSTVEHFNLINRLQEENCELLDDNAELQLPIQNTPKEVVLSRVEFSEELLQENDQLENLLDKAEYKIDVLEEAILHLRADIKHYKDQSNQRPWYKRLFS
jgi:hypothetical protein